jgi:glycosyltransferase involved in cell wall biosynthesis
VKVSIALATYNGAKHLPAQLESFSAQRLLPHELVVCDDQSTDDTLQVLQDFRQTAPFDVRIIPNETRLGYSANFEKAINSCAGDFVFVSDQDDVWFPDKIASVVDAFARSKAMVVINDQEITDGELRPSGRTIMRNTKALGFEDSWLSAGCCTAMRREFLEVLTPFPNDLVAYDAWIHRLAVDLGTREILPQVHQLYRRHESNTSTSLGSTLSAPNRLTAFSHYGLRDVSDAWDVEVQTSKTIVQRLREREAVLARLNLRGASELALQRKTNFLAALEQRRSFLARGRLRRVVPLFGFFLRGGYQQFSGVKSAAKDLLRPATRSPRTTEERA